MLNFIKNLQSNQRYAFVVLVLSIIYGLMGFGIEESFVSDPVGSSLWVQGIAICLIGFSVLLWFFPLDYAGNFPILKEWINIIPFVALILIYSNFLPYLGFLLTTPILITLIGVIFKARLIPAIISAVIMTICCYLVFDFALDISLPTGLIFK